MGDSTTGQAPELTTVADDEAVVHIGAEVRRYRGLIPDTSYDLDGITVHTLPRPGGQLLSVVATVNDVHFGEVECGRVDGTAIGPILQSGPDEPPYPETMNAGAIAEILALRDGAGPDAVVVKGDLTAEGTEGEYEDFLVHYDTAFPGMLHHVRGNHDATHGTFAAFPTQEVGLPGATLAILDTSIPGKESGRVTSAQLEWLDEIATRHERVLLFTHHQPWDPGSSSRPDRYFGINPDDSERLVEVIARRRALAGCFSGHTHRNRVRSFAAVPTVPMVEVACVKDYPGSWAEYRVYEGGVIQVHRRVSTAAALNWTNRTRALFGGQYAQYSFGALADRCFVFGER